MLDDLKDLLVECNVSSHVPMVGNSEAEALSILNDEFMFDLLSAYCASVFDLLTCLGLAIACLKKHLV